MPFDEGLSDWRVYSAEQAVGSDEVLDDIAACQALVDSLTSSSWWQSHFPNTPPIEIVGGGSEHQHLNLRESFASPWGHPQTTRWTVSLHPAMLTTRVLLHEVAHCAAPYYVVEDHEPRYRRGKRLAVSHSKHLAHGAFFAATLAAITGHVVLGDQGGLRAAFDHFEAPVASADELRRELDAQPKIVDEEVAYLADLRQFMEDARASTTTADNPRPPSSYVPETPWGFYLEMTRRRIHRRRKDGSPLLSQRRLAEQISTVFPCSARNISELEHLRQPPDSPAQLTRAMMATICLGMDPIWTRYNLQLTRWGCGDITLEQARRLNPGWAELVEHINELLKAMPPRWSVSGSR
ncbi:hypothetical protein CH275_16860 [Rhodococcus sp. 06-235-1A]|nr:hypothetical protein CH275_16860 [Rhodococcus sp. 06-235-1A]